MARLHRRKMAPKLAPEKSTEIIGRDLSLFPAAVFWLGFRETFVMVNCPC